MGLAGHPVANLKMITHSFSLEDIREAFDTFITRRDGALKVVIHPNGKEEQPL